MKNEQLVTLIFKTIPHPDLIKDLDFSDKNVVRFTWRDERFRVEALSETSLLVEQDMGGSILRSSNNTILMDALLELNLLKVNK